ncbi:MAG: UDP-N-acetylmuramate dehydrogenase [Verrucomicrobiota bacterium]|nr:UDP-N-acetylmuramate dehydrogenase [Verrucomicrobiota bacterium]
MIIKKNVSLADFSTYLTGGTAEELYFPGTVTEYTSLIRSFIEKETNYYVFGGGANILFASNIKRPVVSTLKMDKIIITEDGIVTAEAGVILNDLILATINNAYGGLERLSGIPGTVGGAIYMNAGACKSEISDYLIDVTVVNEKGDIKTLSKKDCKFGYRSASALTKKHIISGRWKLGEKQKKTLCDTRKAILKEKALKQPLNYPSAGSVFKRPENDYASRLIDEAHLKGYIIGDAQVSEKHAGFIINLGNATPEDIIKLIKHCRKEVKRQFRIDLELEQKIIINDELWTE